MCICVYKVIMTKSQSYFGRLESFIFANFLLWHTSIQIYIHKTWKPVELCVCVLLK